MSHFLARLAAGVTQSPSSANAPKLRPLVGSIYQPLGIRAAGESAAPLAVEALEHSSSALHSQPAEPRPAIAAPAQRRQVLGREVSAQPRPAPVQSANSPQILAAEAHETLLPPQPPEPEVHTAVRSSLDESGRNQPAQPVLEAPRVEPDRFLLQSAQANPPQLLMPQAAIEPAVRPARTQVAAPARRAGQPSGEPDEIHIHIGRVEVAAITQPAVRPAPSALARKAMSLDEYLRRSNGRSR